MLFVRNNNTMSLFLFRVRTSQPCLDQAIANAIAFARTVLDMPLGCARFVCFCYKYIFKYLMAAFKVKS